MMQATGNSTSVNIEWVTGGIVLLALLGLIVLNRATLNVKVG
jgi:hypothetical protein